jgi:hypothetical protein
MGKYAMTGSNNRRGKKVRLHKIISRKAMINLLASLVLQLRGLFPTVL